MSRTNKMLSCFEGIREPRKSNHCHKLIEILFIACCAVICGAESWDDIEWYGKSKRAWLKSFLELAHGIPSDEKNLNKPLGNG